MTIKPGTATSTAVHCTADLLQISLCKSQPTAGRLPLPLSNLYLHTARVGLWTDRLEAATVDLRFFVCRFVSGWMMYGHEAGHERPASREDAGVELRSPEKGWSRPPAARVLCRGRSPLVVEPTATQVPAKVMTKRNSQRLVSCQYVAAPPVFRDTLNLRTGIATGTD